MDTLLLQYIIVAVIVLSAGWSIFRIIKKTFAPKKFNSKRTHCDSDCKCS